jgi:hypothetical protein
MSRHPGASDRQAALTFRRRRYLVVKGILPPVMLDYLRVYYAILLANDKLHKDSQCPSSLALGGDPALDALLEWIRPKISRLVGFDLAPTYSYTRRYAKGEVLVRHTDRAACQISVTIAITIPKRAKPSVIHLKPPESTETKIEMFEGDGCIYAGTEVEHWREPFRAAGYIQLFLHFVAKRGRRSPGLIFDGRKCLGALYACRPRSGPRRKTGRAERRRSRSNHNSL